MTGPDAYRVPIYLVTGILVLALMKAGEAIFIPLALSLFTIALVWPLQAWLERVLPRLLALLMTLLVTMMVVLAVGSAVVWGFSRLVQWLFANGSVLQASYLDSVEWLEEHGLAIAAPLSERYNVGWLIGVMQNLVGRLNGMLGYVILIVIFVMLGLLEVGDFAERLRARSAQPFGERMITANRMIGVKLRRYMLVRTVASVVTGVLVWAFALFAGLELAAAWGTIAFALNYIPFLGPLIATVFPTVFAIVQFDWRMGVLVFVGLNIVQFVIGSYIEPRLTGASLAISPFAVMFAVFFGSFVWGVAGAFIGVPILITVIAYCATGASTKWLAMLLSPGGIDDTAEAPAGDCPKHAREHARDE